MRKHCETSIVSTLETFQITLESFQTKQYIPKVREMLKIKLDHR
jgi:hypothetical protein